jgi:hypothetical protein
MPIASKTTTIRPDFMMACRRYPVPVLAAALIACWLLNDVLALRLLARIPLDENHQIQMLFFGFFAATAAGFAAANQPFRLSWVIQCLVFLAGAAAGFAMPAEEHTVLPFGFALICALTLAAGAAARQGVSGYWFANARLTAALAGCVAAAGIITLGGGIVLFSIEALLNLKMDRTGEVLAILLWAFALPASWLALARVDFGPDEHEDNVLLRILSLVIDALLIPLVLIFAAVIHLYAVRIAVLGELPKGEIGWIVPVYLMVGYGIFLLAQNPEMQLPRLRHPLRRFFMISTVVPLILLGLAVAVRIGAYGITEDRYLLVLIVVGGMLLLGAAVVRRPFDIRLVPVVAGTLSLVMAFGPLSARTIAIRSQTARAYAILASVPAERWAASKDGGLSEPQKQDLISAVRHLQRRNALGLAALDPVWPSNLPKDAGILQGLLTTKTTTFVSSESGVLRLQRATFIQQFYLDWQERSKVVSNGSLELTLLVQGHWLDVSGESTVARFDLSSLLMMEISALDAVGPSLVLPSQEGRQGDLILDRVERTEGPNGRTLKEIQGKIILY